MSFGFWVDGASVLAREATRLRVDGGGGGGSDVAFSASGASGATGEVVFLRRAIMTKGR